MVGMVLVDTFTGKDQLTLVMAMVTGIVMAMVDMDMATAMDMVMVTDMDMAGMEDIILGKGP